jgi:protein-disulfide isomerase
VRRLSGVALLLALAGCNGDGGVARVPVEGSPMRGPADAWVTMVEFADFQCPYCGRAAPTVRQVAQTWPDDVRVVFKHLPLSFHAHALSAALAAQCAFEQGRFWEMYDALFADQSKLADADLAQTAQALGLDTGAWTACLSSDEARQKVQADVDLSDQIGVTGTPAFYVNGERIAGAQPFETFRTVIEAKLAAARASGIPAAEYYDKAVLGR